MKRFLSIFLALTLFLFGAFAAGLLPNIGVIFVDDMGYTDLWCLGSFDIRKPSLDTLTEEGMCFTHFYAQPVCDPSRAALVTDYHPHCLAGKGNVTEVRNIQLNSWYRNEYARSDLKIELFGGTDDAAFGIASIGLQGLMRLQLTEILTKAAHQHNIPSVTTASIETVGELTEENAWFQLYHSVAGQFNRSFIIN